MSARTRSAALALIMAAAGAAIGLLTERATGQAPCTYQACDVQYQTCFNTDVAASCTGVQRCQSALCGGGGPDLREPEQPLAL